jgi:hypothetical protein
MQHESNGSSIRAGGTAGGVAMGYGELSDPDVLASGSLRPLPFLERHSLPFAKRVEARIAAGRVVEEVFIPIAAENEPETLVADDAFDRAGHCRHTELLEMRSLLMTGWSLWDVNAWRRLAYVESELNYTTRAADEADRTGWTPKRTDEFFGPAILPALSIPPIPPSV